MSWIFEVVLINIFLRSSLSNMYIWNLIARTYVKTLLLGLHIPPYVEPTYTIYKIHDFYMI